MRPARVAEARRNLLNCSRLKACGVLYSTGRETMNAEEVSPPTIAAAINEGADALRAGGVPEARREAGSLLAHALGRDRAFLITHGEEKLTNEQAAHFRALVARRAAGEPFQYITGRQEFYGLDFEVTPDVLIPRPETELLVETALELLKDAEAPHLCDIGTGTGCIPVTLLHERRDARGVGADISPAALRVAARNALRHGVHDRLSLQESDCFDFLGEEDDDLAEDDDAAARTRFHLIVSNPPYVAEDDLEGLQREVRDHEPRVALTPGGDGLRVIRRLVAESPRHLAPGGHLLFEIGFNQHERVARLIDPRVWTLLDIHEDLQGIPRIVALRLRD
jgi:release factor glutamine methyltransferase